VEQAFGWDIEIPFARLFCGPAGWARGWLVDPNARVVQTQKASDEMSEAEGANPAQLKLRAQDGTIQREPDAIGHRSSPLVGTAYADRTVHMGRLA
jgi:hypothetical protein